MRKLVIIVVASAVTGMIVRGVLRKMRARTSAPPMEMPDANLGTVETPFVDELVVVGIADVDPQPMTQISGEGVDLDTAAGADELPPRADRGQ
jgi:hypothetical protein